MNVEIGMFVKKFMLIDAEDYYRLKHEMKPYTGLRVIAGRGQYYAEFTNLNGENISIHRWISCPSRDKIVDHINGNGLDNRRCNLRNVSYSENMLNRRKFAGIKTTTKLHHISYKKRAGTFYVRIVKDGKEYSKGGFKTIEEAIVYHKVLLPKLYPNQFTTIFEENGYVAKQA